MSLQVEDLKGIWRRAEAPRTSAEELRRVIESRVQASQRLLTRNLMIELSLMIVLVAASLAMILFAGLTPFTRTIWILVLVLMLPSVALFVRHLRRWHRIDYGEPLREQLDRALADHRRTMRVYRYLSYGFCAAVATLLVVWPFAEEPPSWAFRIPFIAWCAVGALAAKPYLRWMFGREAEKVDRLARELRDPGDLYS